jgi:hypothetical protein
MCDTVMGEYGVLAVQSYEHMHSCMYDVSFLNSCALHLKVCAKKQRLSTFLAIRAQSVAGNTIS